MKFLSEITEDVNIVVESCDSSQEKSYFIEGIFLQSDLKNKNGRVYPYEVLVKECQRYKEQMVDTKRALGELGHPPGASINFERVSHMITDLFPSGKEFIGKAKLLSTPYGEIAKNFIKEGVKLGVSSRGFGSVDNRGGVSVVGSDFFLATVDIVHDPSAPQAFVNGIMENKEFYFDNGILVERDYEAIQKQVKDLSKTQIDEGALLQIFEKFIKSL